MKRLAIVGTAETWKDAPYGDPSWRIATLNDAYRLGIPRADLWYDTHKPEEWYLVPPGQMKVNAWDLPPGKHYPRPHDHPQFFERLKIPAYVYEARPDWPTSITFPWEAVDRHFTTYQASSPALMLAHAMLPEDEGGLGYTAGDEIGIWGIHLATEKEYLEQSPNFHWLIGRAEERGITITLPDGCPLRMTPWRYARDPRPTFGVPQMSLEMQRAMHERDRILKWLLGPQAEPLKFELSVPLWVGSNPKDRLAYAEAAMTEAQGRIHAAQLRERGLAA